MGFISRRMALHMRYRSWCISLPSSTKQWGIWIFLFYFILNHIFSFKRVLIVTDSLDVQEKCRQYVNFIFEFMLFSASPQWLRLVNRPRSIYKYSSIGPRLSGKNCKFFMFLLSLNFQKRFGYKENITKYRRLNWKPRNHGRILVYWTWPIAEV